jgi:protein-S-isoprenylcysteine O-methyltransferase Ste14
MGIGVGIVLLLIGLILVSGAIDLPASVNDVVATNTLGWIFILVGILGLVLGVVASRRARTSTVVEERRVR